MAYSVSQRNQEIGLRMALGAAQGDVLGMVLKQAMILVGLGTAAGLALALAISNVVATILYGTARDPLTFVAVPATLSFGALLASLIPALRASRVDPLSPPCGISKAASRTRLARAPPARTPASVSLRR